MDKNKKYYTVYFNSFFANKQMNSRTPLKCYFEKLEEAIDYASEYVGEKVSIISNTDEIYCLSSPIGKLEIKYQKTLSLYPNLDID
jgi:hypothetical protein